jgi:hypothetical protein
MALDLFLQPPRRAALSFLESASPCGGASPSTTAAATTGPASGPRPASSTLMTKPCKDVALTEEMCIDGGMSRTFLSALSPRPRPRKLRFADFGPER